MSTSHAAESARRLRQERDRHVAFAFAAADLLIEVGVDGVIIDASGASHAILGLPVSDLTGRRFIEYVEAEETPLARHLLRQVCTLLRIDLSVVRMHAADGATNRVLLGGCRLPDRSDSYFLSIALVPDALAPPAQPRDEVTGLLTADGLRAAALRIAGEQERDAKQLQVVRLDGLANAASRLPAERAALLMQEIGAALRASSVGGDAAGRLSEEAFGIVPKPGQHARRDAALSADIAEVIRGAGIPDDQVRSHITRIAISLGQLNRGDAAGLLDYAISAFVKAVGGTFDIASLQKDLTTAVDQAAARFIATRQMLTDEAFDLVFQPVVNLASRKLHHYEALSRFPDPANTYDTIVFSEDVGLIMDLDLIVCRRVGWLLEGNNEAMVAVNLSGRSVQNNAFRSALIDLSNSLGDIRQRLMFELTESAAVENMEETASFLAQLRRMGHAVCLDDFGSGAAAYSYIRRFDVDFVKIDGPFLKAASTRGREHALVRSICVLCNEIGCRVIGEMIEDEAGAAAAAELGIGYGQGWFYGKPLAELPPPARPVRRKGATETWQ